jgi:restriction system protein
VQVQIDGLIVLDGRPILVEAKWLSTPIGQAEIARHLVRVYGLAEVTGLFVSASPYTEAAISECKNALSQRVFVLAEVNEIVMLLKDPKASLAEWLRAEVMAASVERASRSTTRRCSRARLIALEPPVSARPQASHYRAAHPGG